MPRLTTLAKAVRLAVRAEAETLALKATEELYVMKPLVMSALGSVKYVMKHAALTLVQEAKQVSFYSNVSAVQLQLKVSTDFAPIDLSQPSMVGTAMVGEFMLG